MDEKGGIKFQFDGMYLRFQNPSETN